MTALKRLLTPPTRPVAAGLRRPELRRLDPDAKARVLRLVRARRLRCPACGRRRFTVGDELFLGFLFVTAEQDEHMIALTCNNRRCPAPRTGVVLHTDEFAPSD